jgi:hypothetical protein
VLSPKVLSSKPQGGIFFGSPKVLSPKFQEEILFLNFKE